MMNNLLNCKMMKKIILFAWISLFCFSVTAQETFFPLKPGTVMGYKIYNKKGKESSGIRYTIKDVKGTPDNLTITYEFEALDTKDKLVYSEEITIVQKGSSIYFDMNNFVNKAAFQKNGEIPAEVKITGNELEIPVDPVSGSTLPDASVTMEMSMGIINMKMTATSTNRKVEGWEDVTVKAGTYKACKFTSDVNSIVLGLNVQSKVAEWYAKGVGVVKSETYSKKGDLMSLRELVEFKQ